jgi:hypothetical protein
MFATLHPSLILLFIPLQYEYAVKRARGTTAAELQISQTHKLFYISLNIQKTNCGP